jgi:hypothetical protein
LICLLSGCRVIPGGGSSSAEQRPRRAIFA